MWLPAESSGEAMSAALSTSTALSARPESACASISSGSESS